MSVNNIENSRINRFFKDEAIENAGSFEEARAIIVSRLNNLRVDLAAYSQAEDSIANEILKVNADKNIDLMNIYADYFSPCKVIDPTFIPKGEVDMNDIMINFSEGFNIFLESLEEKYLDMLIRRRRATILLNRMLSDKFPFSILMYLYYYKHVDQADILDRLFISRATFYRIKSAAINSLTKMYYSSKKKKGTSDDGGGSKESA